MNWTHVILAGYVGAVIAIVVGVFRKKGWIGKTSAVVIALLAIAVWNIIDVKYLITRDNATSQMTEAEKFDQAMEKLPLYQVIREQEPETWRRVREQALSMPTSSRLCRPTWSKRPKSRNRATTPVSASCFRALKAGSTPRNCYRLK